MENESRLRLAARLFAASLPGKPDDGDPDSAPIHIPWRRWVEIEDAILKMYRTADARTMPLDVFEIASAVGCPAIPYRALGQIVDPAFRDYSEDGFCTWRLGGKWAIYYNDRRPVPRQRFSIAHELGHVMLGHREHSELAEHEANHFAAASLCPLPLLALYGIASTPDVARIFKVSRECAENRLKDLNRWRALEDWKRNNRFGEEVRRRFQLLEPYQPFLLQQEECS